MKVKLLTHTTEPDKLVGIAAAKCTDTEDYDKARMHSLASGHDSVAEHAVFTFEISGVSRALLAQLTRHRIASFSVQSQRYVRMSPIMSVIPPKIMENPAALALFQETLQKISDTYDTLINEYGIAKEDARYITPQGACTSLVMTMNGRELRHFFSLRCCNRAQWEIRELADLMLAECRKVAPALFADAGPGCITGGCPETRPCKQGPRLELKVS